MARAVAATVALMLLCAAQASAAGLDGARLSPLGFGPLTIGSTAKQLRASTGLKVSEKDGPGSCSFFRVKGLPKGVELTAFDGRLGYILIHTRGARTTHNTRVGDGTRLLRHQYGAALRRGRSAALSGVQKHRFADRRSNGVTYTLDFELSNGRVAFIAAATRATVEGFGECS